MLFPVVFLPQRGFLQYYVYFHPYLGGMIQIDEHIFQMGWFNNQPVVVFIFPHNYWGSLVLLLHYVPESFPEYECHTLVNVPWKASIFVGWIDEMWWNSELKFFTYDLSDVKDWGHTMVYIIIFVDVQL